MLNQAVQPQWLCRYLQKGNSQRFLSIKMFNHIYRIVEQKLGRPSNRMVVLMHTIFKLAALITYLCASILTSSFIACFITVMIMLSADFWIVKNISGRLLAGLRWWSVVDESGQLVWHYESWTSEQRQLAQQGESMYFWGTLIGCQVMWAFLATVSIFR